jgi:hypothetical protein
MAARSAWRGHRRSAGVNAVESTGVGGRQPCTSNPSPRAVGRAQHPGVHRLFVVAGRARRNPQSILDHIIKSAPTPDRSADQAEAGDRRDSPAAAVLSRCGIAVAK